MKANKLLIANRGEIACRIIRSCRKLGLETVAVYSEADTETMHVSMADEAHYIGPASARESYLRGDVILDLARKVGAGFIHPGYGFLAENADFARAVEACGLVWVGPHPRSIEKMGDKERAREIAIAAGIPVLPGSRRFGRNDVTDLHEAAKAVGYPLLVKAAAGGGGIGMRQVSEPSDLAQVTETTQVLAERAFGNGTVYLERFVPTARHIEIQVFGFGDGSAVHLYERDCSIQRRFQKIVEETPAPGIANPVRLRLAEAALALCRHESYRGAGTIEFVVDASSLEFYFIEMNTRIQVEHPITEMATGLDLVALQLEQARGNLEPFEQSTIRHTGHAIECRIYAENPAKNFMPSPGRLTTLEFPPERHGTRVDTGFRVGDSITPFYDPMIAKLISHGDDRRQAISMMQDMLAATRIDGVKCNVDFLLQIMQDEVFSAGAVTTNFVANRHAELTRLQKGNG